MYSQKFSFTGLERILLSLLLPVVVVLLIFTSSSMVQCYDTCPDSSLITCSEWQTAKDTLEIANYPGCFIECEYRWRICEDTAGNAVVEYSVISFTDPEPSDECNALLDNMWIPYGHREDGEPNWAFIQYIFLQLGFSLVKERFMEEYNLAPPNQKWRYECPNYRERFTLDWRSCTREVVFKIGGGGTGPVFYVWVTSPCNDAVCCKQKLKICWDKINNQMNIEEEWEVLVEECDPYPPPVPGAVWSSPCFPWCGVPLK